MIPVLCTLFLVTSPIPTPLLSRKAKEHILTFYFTFRPLKNPDGSNITTENLRGTRLYGWADCQTNEINDITEAWNDFHTLANQDSVYKNIDWSENIARDFWGPSTGPNAIPDSRKTEILRRLRTSFSGADTNVIRDLSVRSANVRQMVVATRWTLGTALPVVEVSLAGGR